MNSELPLVSAIMPVFNGQRYLRGAIESVLSQTYRRIELTVVNDGSTDETAKILDGYQGRIRVINQSNQGQGVARNRAIAVAQGTLLAFLDSDDLWDARKIERQVALWRERSAAIGVYCDFRNIDETGRITRTTAALSRPNPSGKVLEQLLWRPYIGLPTVLMVRKDVVQLVGGFNENFSRYGEDYALWLKLATLGALVYSPETLASYRRHSEQTTSPGNRAEYMRAEGMFSALDGAGEYIAKEQDARVRELYRDRRWSALCALGWVAGRNGDWRRVTYIYGKALRERPWRIDQIGSLFRALARCCGHRVQSMRLAGSGRPLARSRS